MCGIVGYVGKSNALPITLEGLKRLEYRGYDSAGVAFLNDNSINVIKQKGRLSELIKAVDSNLSSNCAIGHTRWATHGEPSVLNAHPHGDCKSEIFLVHNGIIENYSHIKEKLIQKGHKFLSETDTEVLTHLVEENYRDSLEQALRDSLKMVTGAYAIAVISKKDPDKIVFARKSSPLLVGLGANENFVASDASAILGHTKKVIYLDDGEIGIITADDFKIFNLDHDLIEKETHELEWDIEEAEKQGYDYFMLKEIMETPESIVNAMRGRIILSEGNVKLGGLDSVIDRLDNIDRIVVVAMGTALFAGKVGEYMIEEYAGIPVEVEDASEFRYKKAVLNKNDLVLVISQSGETADTLFAIKEAKQKGILTVGIINVIGSSIAREVDAGIYNHAGPEIGVAASKSLISQISILTLLCIFLGRRRDMSLVTGQRILEELTQLPNKIKEILDNQGDIEKLAKEYYKSSDFLFLGRKYNYPIALEGALKLKEISYIHAEGFAAGELKHGSIALIDENMPSMVIAPQDSVYEKIISSVKEIKARKGRVIAISTIGDKEIVNIVDDCIFIPKTLEMLTPILTAIPLQLFAYHIAVLLNLDVDKPRNLAKSVTVE
jgi:glutamine---fructose-6-phosphate transaminase (isomerizing)